MPYRMNGYQGDYSQGGYGYRGDPGLFSSIGKILKKAAPVLGRFFGPVGTVVGAALGAAEATKMMIPAPPQLPAPGAMPGGGFLPAAGQVIGGAVAGYRQAGVAGVGGLCPSGYHPAKDGSGRCVRNRRMNIANPRALRRSMRRVQGFEKLARKTISFTKRVKMKRRRR